VFNARDRRPSINGQVTPDEISKQERGKRPPVRPPRSVIDDLDEEMRGFGTQKDSNRSSGLRGHEAALAEEIAERAAAEARRKRAESRP